MFTVRVILDYIKILIIIEATVADSVCHKVGGELNCVKSCYILINMDLLKYLRHVH